MPLKVVWSRRLEPDSSPVLDPSPLPSSSHAASLPLQSSPFRTSDSPFTQNEKRSGFGSVVDAFGRARGRRSGGSNQGRRRAAEARVSLRSLNHSVIALRLVMSGPITEATTSESGLLGWRAPRPAGSIFRTSQCLRRRQRAHFARQLTDSVYPSQDRHRTREPKSRHP